MTPRRVVALFVVIVAFCLFAAGQSFASQARIVRLSFLDGTVDIERPGVDSERAVLNMPVIQGTRLVVGQGGAVEIEFENSSTLRAVGPAIITFRELSLNGDGGKTTYVELQPGTYYFNIDRKGDDDFRVSTLDRTVRVNKDARFRIIASPEDSRIAVFKGEVKLQGPEGEVTVKKNETLTLDIADPGRYYLAKGIEAGPEDAWDEQREQYREQYAQAQSWKYANASYGGPYSYGFTDLNYYGNYFNVPGWGWMWRPAYFGPDWDPYDNGAWSFYPGQGWMFVSLYPWGWTPYRYGQWVWVPAYGWCWRPGNRYNSWNAVPIFRNPPPRWRRQSPPPQSTWRRTVIVNPKPPGPGTWHQPNQPSNGKVVVPPGARTPATDRGSRQTTQGSTGLQRQPVVVVPPNRESVRDDPTPRGSDDVGRGVVVNPRPTERTTHPMPPSVAPTPKQEAPQRVVTPPSAPPVQPPVERTPAPRSESPRVTPPADRTPAPRSESPRVTTPPAEKAPAPRSESPRFTSPPVDRTPAPRSEAPRTSSPAPSGGAGTWHAPSGRNK